MQFLIIIKKKYTHKNAVGSSNFIWLTLEISVSSAIDSDLRVDMSPPANFDDFEESFSSPLPEPSSSSLALV